MVRYVLHFSLFSTLKLFLFIDKTLRALNKEVVYGVSGVCILSLSHEDKSHKYGIHIYVRRKIHASKT